MSFNEELHELMTNFSLLQSCLKGKLSLVEKKIQEIEHRIENSKKIKFNNNFNYESTLRDEICIKPQEPKIRTRDIIEGLMWNSTFSGTALYVQKVFKDNDSREKFLRNALEIVIEKDEQYRKIVGRLFGQLINQNIVTEQNILNSLCSVLIVIENSDNLETKAWQNISEVLLPLITESHINLFHLKHEVQNILKQEYYAQFVNYLNCSLEMIKNQKLQDNIAINFLKNTSFNCNPLLKDTDFDKKLNNTSQLNSIYKKHDTDVNFENILYNSILSGNMEQTISLIKNIKNYVNTEILLEKVICTAIKKTDLNFRKSVGKMFNNLLAQNLIDHKSISNIFHKCISNLELLIINQETRMSISHMFADILLPILSNGKTELQQVINLSSIDFPEKIKIVFMWSLEKIIQNRGVKSELKLDNTVLRDSFLEKYPKLFEINNVAEDFKYCKDFAQLEINKECERLSITSDINMHNNNNVNVPCRNYDGGIENEKIKEAIKETENFTKQTSDERIENISHNLKINNELDTDVNLHEASSNTENNVIEMCNEELRKPPETLTSNLIKEKIEEIIENMITTEDKEKFVSIIKNTFNDCQIDLVFKAAYEYTKDKSSDYRIQCSHLISKAFENIPRRIAAPIMNILSLELGDFVDSADLWNNMAETIFPLILNGILQFNDFKLLPKFFLRSKHCTSLLQAVFKQITDHQGHEWLVDNWKTIQVNLSEFLPTDSVIELSRKNNLKLYTKIDEES